LNWMLEEFMSGSPPPRDTRSMRTLVELAAQRLGAELEPTRAPTETPVTPSDREGSSVMEGPGEDLRPACERADVPGGRIVGALKG